MAQLIKLNDGTTLKIRGKAVFEFTNLGVVKQVDVEGRRMVMVGSDETRDRDGDIIRMAGWQLENYRKNPVFLWSHNYGSVPLARSEKVIRRKDPPRLEHHLLYPTKGLHPFADMILELYGEKMINASSVGFIPWKWNDIEEENENDKNTRRVWGREFVKQELLELSGCAVPSNPNALQDALKAKSFLDAPFEDVQRWLQGKAVPPRPEKEDDVLGELDKPADYEEEADVMMVQVPDNLEENSTWDKDKEELDALPEEEIIEEEIEIPSFEKEFEITKEDVSKPYPNEHACRLKSPDKYDRFARKNCYKKHDGKCVDFIFGYPKEGGGELQAMRYKKDVWMAGAAKTHCSSHKGTFEAASGKSVEEILLEILEEIKSTDIWLKNSLVSTIRDQNTEILEALKSLKPSGTDLVLQPIDQSPKDVGKEKIDASETILGNVFEQGKAKSVPPSAPPQPQYDFRGVISALSDLKNSFKPLEKFLTKGD